MLPPPVLTGSGSMGSQVCVVTLPASQPFRPPQLDCAFTVSDFQGNTSRIVRRQAAMDVATAYRPALDAMNRVR